MKRRRTCGRWRTIQGWRRVCSYDKGHTGGCEWAERLAAAVAKERAENDALRKRIEAGQLLGEHADSGCEPCAGYVAAVTEGAVPSEAMHMRCGWAVGLQRLITPESWEVGA